MNVLSLFDGMSCGQLALNKLGIKYDNYYASEIDKYAIKVTQANFPKTIQIGDVCNVNSKDYKNVSLILCGSPCQGFSFAGKQLAFDDPRSALFFEFIRLLKEIKPKYFLLENVRMKQEFQDVITEQVSACYPDFKGGDLFGSQIKPILINSALLSAQNRQRLYWTNIPNIEQPEDKGIVLKDILEDVDTYGHANGYVETKPKQVGLAVEKVKVRKHEVDIPRLQNVLRTSKKESKKTNKQIAKEIKKPTTKVEHWFRTDSSFAIPSDDVWYKLKEILNIDNNEFDKSIMEFHIRDGVYETTQRVYSQEGKSPTLTSAHAEKLVETKPKQVGIAADINGYDSLKRVYSPEGKSPTLTTCQGGNREPKVVSGAWRVRYKEDGTTEQRLKLNKSGKSNSLTTMQRKSVVVNEELSWRKLTPLECERLQTVPDNYTNHVSNTQRYKILGNSFTVDVIAHILSFGDW